jgi:hypothetical protein
MAAVLFLRSNKNTPDKLEIENPAGILFLLFNLSEDISWVDFVISYKNTSLMI